MLKITTGTFWRIVLGLFLALLLSLFGGAVGMYFNEFLSALSIWPAILVILVLGVLLLMAAIAFLVVMSNSAEPVASFNPSRLQAKKVVILPLSDIYGLDAENEELLGSGPIKFLGKAI